MASTFHSQSHDPDKAALDKRLEAIGWGLFLIMIGCLALVPDRWIDDGVWLVGTGVIMLGLNAVRYAYQVKMSVFTIVLGLIALSSGLSEVAGINVPVVAILLIAIGAHVISKTIRDNHHTATPAQ